MLLGKAGTVFGKVKQTAGCVDNSVAYQKFEFWVESFFKVKSLNTILVSCFPWIIWIIAKLSKTKLCNL